MPARFYIVSLRSLVAKKVECFYQYKIKSILEDICRVFGQLSFWLHLSKISNEEHCYRFLCVSTSLLDNAVAESSSPLCQIQIYISKNTMKKGNDSIKGNVKFVPAEAENSIKLTAKCKLMFVYFCLFFPFKLDLFKIRMILFLFFFLLFVCTFVLSQRTACQLSQV